MEYEIHPLANCLPEMPEDQFDAFKEDISGLGVLEPITILDGMILDGRHRYRACKELGIECPTRVLSDVSPHDLVRSMNLYRRHLSTSQRAIVAAALLEPFEREAKKAQATSTGGSTPQLRENLPQADNQKSTDKAGALLGVSGRTVRDAKVIRDEGTPEEVKAVTQGKKTVSAVAKEVKQRRPDVIAVQPKRKKPEKKRIVFGEPNENIGWAAYSWNPVKGCKHGCPYCYAKAISDRYGWSFEPHILEDRLGPTDSKLKVNKNNRVFTCSMGELFGPWVPDEWIEKVFTSVKQNPEWTFLFLTKSPERLPKLEWPANAWIGSTIDTQKRVEAVAESFYELDQKIENIKFISCEPLLEEIVLPDKLLTVLDWIIIGAKSEGQKKIQPDWHWVHSLVGQALQFNVSVWLKDNLIFRPQETPEEFHP